jgi:hypothetical protein
MALVALDISRRVKIVVVARLDSLVGQKIGDVEADDLCSVVVSGRGFDALEETWDETKVDGASKTHEAVECPDGDAAVDEPVVFSFVDFDVAVDCQQKEVVGNEPDDERTNRLPQERPQPVLCARSRIDRTSWRGECIPT